MTAEEKEFFWKEKRRGKITASTLPDLMTKGRGEPFGAKALAVLYPIRYERRTGLTRESQRNKNFDWGHENEPLAIEWIRTQLMGEVKSCSEDFDEIVFNEPFKGFGDSPDFYVYAPDGVTVTAIGEIKCPISQGKIEELQFLRAINEKTEYYYQFLGHFIGRPDVETLYYVIYDGYSDSGKIIEMKRADHLEAIAELTERIKLADTLIDDSLELDKDFPELLAEMKEEAKAVEVKEVKVKEPKPKATRKKAKVVEEIAPIAEKVVETVESLQMQIEAFGEVSHSDTKTLNKIRIINKKIKQLKKKKL